MSKLFKNILFNYSVNCTPILLVIILIFNIFGFYYYFNFLQDNIRREIRTMIREGLKEDELTLIEINVQNQAEIIWLKPGKEFTYRGKMYDVVRKTLKNGNTLYHCINDIKENKLISDFAKKAGHSQKSTRLLNIHATVFISLNASSKHILEILDHEYYTHSVDLTSRIKEIADPPPKIFLASTVL